MNMNARRWQLVRWIGILILLVAALPLPVLAQVELQSERAREIYLPLVPHYESIATPVPTLAVGTRLYGVLGQLESHPDRLYDHYLAAADGRYFALAGETPEIEQQIVALADAPTLPLVKVWGEAQPSHLAGQPQIVVVTGILATDLTPTPPPTAQIGGASAQVAVVRFDEVNLYAGPATTFAKTGQVIARQACNVTGRNVASTWLQLACGDGQAGWIDARLVEVEGRIAALPVVEVVSPQAVATPQPAVPTPQPTPVIFSGWRMELFANVNLAGTPVAVVDVPTVDFNWGSAGPAQTGSDNFSLRFSRRIAVVPGYYAFTAVADDGVRVWVDGNLIINAWPASPNQAYAAGLVLTGSHDVRVDYYEAGGLARVKLDYAPQVADTQWQATYFFGVTPTGNPAFQQQEARGQNPLDYNWSVNSPRPGVLPPDYWSAVWEGEFPFDAGNYRFQVNADDGVRLYVDGLLVIDAWRDGYKTLSNRLLGIGAGVHTVRVEYYQRTGNAQLEVWWYRDSAYTGLR
jgi:hypothetical protein